MAFSPHNWKDGETIITAEIMKSIENELVAIRTELPLLMYPVGYIWMSTENTNPESIVGGKWTPWGSGRVPVGVDQSQTEFNTPEKSGGSKATESHKHTTPNHNHTITVASGGSHTHTISTAKTTKTGGTSTRANSSKTGTSGSHTHALNQTSSGGGNTGLTGGTGNGNLQPYITCYMFKRTA